MLSLGFRKWDQATLGASTLTVLGFTQETAQVRYDSVEHTVRSDLRTELAPGIYVQLGPEQSEGLRLVFEAPRDVRIRRVPR